MKKKKYFLLTAGALAALAVLFFAAVFIGNRPDDRTGRQLVLYLNGAAVSVDEYELMARENRSRILMQYSSEEANQDDFWVTDFGGTYPWEQLSELVLEELRQKYAIKELAAEMGLTEDYTFQDLQEAMNEKNKAAASDVDGEIQYGITAFDMDAYYQYWYSNLETTLVTALISGAEEVPEAECEDYYEAHIDEYTYETGVRLLYAEIPLDPQKKEEAFKQAQDIVQMMEERKDGKSLQKAFPDAGLEELELTSLDRQEGLSGVYSRRWEIASRLGEGEVYGPYEDNGFVCVIKCTGRTENGRIPFSEAESDIQAFLQRTYARSTLDARAAGMEITEGKISARDVIAGMQ